MSPAPTPARPEDELLEQWSFLDSMVERQAEALRTGSQDAEEVDAVTPDAQGPDDVALLRGRIAVLERDAAALRAQLEGRDREIQRAQQHGAELMRSLRDAHAAVEDAQQAATAAERRAAAAEASAAAPPEAPAAPPAAEASAGSAPTGGGWSERPRRSAIFANQDPPPPPAKPSFLDRLLGRR
ncbi:MAG: hypothetical protein ABR541_09075 [Candidatus Dormibacteria bacterium]